MAEKEEKKAKALGTDLKSVPEELIAEACKAYGIDPKYVFASAYHADTGEAVIVTNGGSKVRFKVGDKVAPLDQIAVTGINPKPKHKPITGPEKK
jgi:hypothetical protein